MAADNILLFRSVSIAALFRNVQQPQVGAKNRVFKTERKRWCVNKTLVCEQTVKSNNFFLSSLLRFEATAKFGS